MLAAAVEIWRKSIICPHRNQQTWNGFVFGFVRCKCAVSSDGATSKENGLRYFDRLNAEVLSPSIMLTRCRFYRTVDCAAAAAAAVVDELSFCGTTVFTFTYVHRWRMQRATYTVRICANTQTQTLAGSLTCGTEAESDRTEHKVWLEYVLLTTRLLGAALVSIHFSSVALFWRSHFSSFCFVLHSGEIQFFTVCARCAIAGGGCVCTRLYTNCRNFNFHLCFFRFCRLLFRRSR